MSSTLFVRLLIIVALALTELSFTSADLPAPPQKLSLSEITASSMKLSWKRGNSDDIGYIVQYKAKQDPNGFREIKGINTTEFVIDMLQPFLQYEFRTIAITKTGRSPPSMLVEAVTGELGAYVTNCPMYTQIGPFCWWFVAYIIYIESWFWAFNGPQVGGNLFVGSGLLAIDGLDINHY